MNISYAVVQAFERTKNRRSERASRRFFTIALLVVFFLALMGGLAVGVSVYSSVASTQAETNAMRMETGLVASIVRANDATDALGTGTGPEGPSLVMTERLSTGTYEMRIYLYEGQIVEEYSVAGTPCTPERAQALMPSESFDFSISGNLLTVTTDQGSVDIALRCAQGQTGGA